MRLLPIYKCNLLKYVDFHVPCRTLSFFACSFGRQKFEHGNPIECLGFTYYPRFPNHKDPPVQPSKVFMVKRIKPLKGTLYWEKHIMKELKLDGKHQDVVIMKNIPESNARLWQVKHLVQITPIVFPNGPPGEEDVGSTFLKENGELLVSKRLKVDPERLEVSEEKENLKMDKDTIRKQCRLRWLNPWQT
ncbi:large ribosomal subunit protein uL30m [Hetaerina americana]|uniref:large ribosomal subunit protein uL30m n=1 Tax=Hetaerina americana TaxID=62018 RepID=UPI003A7F21E0